MKEKKILFVVKVSKLEVDYWRRKFLGECQGLNYSFFNILESSVGRWQWAACSVRTLLCKHF